MSSVVPYARSAFADAAGDAAKLQQISARLAQLDQQNGQLADELLGAQADARQAVTDVTAQQTKVAALQQQLGVVQGQVSALALQRFASGDSSGGLGALLGDPAHLTSTVERDEYTKLAVSDGQDAIDQLGAGVDTLNKEQTKLVRQQAAADLKTIAVTKKQRDLDAKAQALEQLKHATELQFGQDKVAEAEAAQQAALQEAQASAVRAKTARAAASPATAASNARPAKSPTAAATVTAKPGSATPPKTPPPPPAAAPGTPTDSPVTMPPKTPSPPSGAGSDVPAPSAGAGGAVKAALSQVGVPYQFAAATPGVAFDCSGLTSWAWAQAGRSMPHQSAQQFASLPHVAQADVQPGDLIFYYSPISHVSMYVGNGQFVDAPGTGSFVRTGTVNWARVVGIARP